MRSMIRRVKARRVWDSRGLPTIEVEVHVEDGLFGRAIAPSGLSRGSREAAELRDGVVAFQGRGVASAVSAVNDVISPALAGRDAADQGALDALLIGIDGTADRRRLGANTMIATSMAAAHAAAVSSGLSLFRHLGGGDDAELPLPEIEIFGGGVHTNRRDVQEIRVLPVGASSYVEALEWGAAVFHAAGRLLADAGRLSGVTDKGGYWPAFDSNEDALDLVVRAIEASGLCPGRDVGIALDVAAGHLVDHGRYHLASVGRELDSDGLCELLSLWIDRFPIVALEDPLGEDDREGMIKLTRAIGDRVQIVADDFVATRAAQIIDAAGIGACNAVALKPSQVGTLTEARAALVAARESGWGVIASGRSGESEDTTIMHIAVGWGIAQLKVGAFSRSERVAKWNEGVRIADELGGAGRLQSMGALRRGVPERAG